MDVEEEQLEAEYSTLAQVESDILAANPLTVKERIDEALVELGDLRNSSRSRADIISSLARDLSEYYGYIPELAEFLLELFPPAECVQYMESSDRPRPLVIRANTLKTSRKDLMEALSKRGANVEAVEWSKVAIKVTESSVPIGATPEYLAGHYMLQSAASMNPVMALAPQPGERILDMSAAPGGKTSYVAQLMKNSGAVIANDLKPQRQKATVANLHRLGVKNAIVCSYDGRKINHVFKGFDRVLLDAPCSGLGVISRDQSVKVQRTVKDIQRIAHLQKELLRAAVDAVNPKSPTGGYIVYSTCSISTEENEQVVNFILQKRFVKLVDTGLEVGRPGYTRHKERRFHPSLSLTRRFYPHVHNMDGFFVAKFKKYANGVRGAADDEDGDEDGDEEGDEDADEEDDGEGADGASDGSGDAESDADDDEDDIEDEKEKDRVATRLAKEMMRGAKGSQYGDDLSFEDESGSSSSGSEDDNVKNKKTASAAAATAATAATAASAKKQQKHKQNGTKEPHAAVADAVTRSKQSDKRSAVAVAEAGDGGDKEAEDDDSDDEDYQPGDDLDDEDDTDEMRDAKAMFKQQMMKFLQQKLMGAEQAETPRRKKRKSIRQMREMMKKKKSLGDA